MGQKSSRFLFTSDSKKNWLSSWFATGKEYVNLAIEDVKIRNYLVQYEQKCLISCVKISRVNNKVDIIIMSSKTSSILGKIDLLEKIKSDISKLSNSDINISVRGVKKPELDANIVALIISSSVSSGKSYKKSIKYALDASTRNGALGMKVIISGRLNGAEIARSEVFKVGSIPLHTIRADIDYAYKTSLTKYGIVGIKVWINRVNSFV